MSIIIVEDEWLIAHDLETYLADRGVAVSFICASVAQALQTLEERRPSAAVLDLKLRGGTSIPLAKALRRLDIPFIFATGYADRNAIPDEFADAPVVNKPYDGKTVLAALTQVVGRPREHTGAD